MTLTDTIEAVAFDTATFNTSFSKQVSNLQLALDSTSLGAFKLCPRLYYYQLILGYAGPAVSDGGEENPHLKFGTLYHSASEVYDHAVAMGATKDEALLDAIKHAITESFDLENNRPWISTEPTKTLDTLLRTLVWYFDHFRDDPLKTLILANGKPAVELSFRFNLADYIEDKDAERYLAPSGEPYSLCGHLDRVVEWNDELWIVDKKTTKGMLNDQYFANYNPDNQISLYTIAGGVVLHKSVEGVVIDAAQIQVNGSRFQRRPIHRTPGQLEEWLFDLSLTLRLMEAYARMGYWPQNDKACSLFGGCKFRPICSLDPSAREEYLEAFYTKRTWDPLVPR